MFTMPTPFSRPLSESPRTFSKYPIRPTAHFWRQGFNGPVWRRNEEYRRCASAGRRWLWMS
jgi:hypothetical protein